MSILQKSYTVLAPIYDFVVGVPTRTARQKSFALLDDNILGKRVLLCGIGSGLDIPFLPTGIHYTGIDLTKAMLKRAQQQITTQDITLCQGDVMQLPYPDNCFDTIIMHLILAVVSIPQNAIDEANRVLVPNGHILIFDKFLKPHQQAPLRRLLNPLASRIATRTDVVFEQLNLHQTTVLVDKPALANGWFRHILLRKKCKDS